MSRSQNRMLMKRPIDEIQMLIQEEPTFRDGVCLPSFFEIIISSFSFL